MNVNFCNFKKSTKSTQQIYIGPRVFNFSATQEGEGTPSPTNVRPLVPGFSFERDDHTTLTVWGGSIAIDTAVLTVTHDMNTFTGSDVTLVSTASGHAYARVLISEVSGRTYSTCKCNSYVPTSTSDNGNITIPAAGQAVARIFNDSFTTIEAAQTAFNAQPVQFVFDLATPQTIQLSVTELQRCCAQLHVPYPIPPIADHYTTYDCTLHENTDIVNPVIKLKTATAEDLLQWNYCYIPAFSRYYFVDKVEWNLGTWLIYLSEDDLASNKQGIGETTQYILRSASEYDGSVIDTAYPTKTVVTEENFIHSGTTVFGTNIAPYFVVGIIAGDMGLPLTSDHYYNGSVVYLALTPAQMDILVKSLMSNISLYSVPSSEISEALQKQLLNPLQYIQSIKVVPFKPHIVEVEGDQEWTISDLPIGFNSGQSAIPLLGSERVLVCKAPSIGSADFDNGYMHHFEQEVRVPVHPDYLSKGRWVLSQPYSRYVISVQPFGDIEVPSGIINTMTPELSSGDYYLFFTIYSDFDISTGDLTLTISARNNQEDYFYCETKNCSITVPVHQSVQDVQGFRNAKREYRNLAFEMVSVNPVQIIKDLVNLSDDITELKTKADKANAVQISGGGSEGSYLAFNRIWCRVKTKGFFQRFVGENRSLIGRPLMQNRQINTLSGFIQCRNAKYAGSALKKENEMIEQHMNGGFFYE